jgi:hypothetical protein
MLYNDLNGGIQYIITVEQILSESARAQDKNYENGILFVNHVYNYLNGTAAAVIESNKLN